jgi:hypothetical protein
MSYTKEQLESAIKAKGYVWFEDPTNKGYDVNIIGIRNMSPGNKVTNIFDDWLTISFKNNSVWEFYCWTITTDPGTKAVKEYHNPNGVARLVPNQYRGSHTIRLHQGKYEALGQQKPVKVWRDKNKDMSFDSVVLDEGLFGINIHRSNPKTESAYVENWSEGCQVFKRVKDFNQFMAICKKAAVIHGNSFTYTLLESTDIK